MNEDFLLRIIAQIILQYGEHDSIKVSTELADKAKAIIDTHLMEFGDGRISLISPESVSGNYPIRTRHDNV